ncbi:MAG: hypothetical protein IJ294_04945, partial [Clostridia bacterium]|nr:hypothetical protein [Clostridia bacterium]
MENEENKHPANVAVTTAMKIASPPLDTADNIIPTHDPKTTIWLILRQYNDIKIRNIPNILATLRFKRY